MSTLKTVLSTAALLIGTTALMGQPAPAPAPPAAPAPPVAPAPPEPPEPPQFSWSWGRGLDISAQVRTGIDAQVREQIQQAQQEIANVKVNYSNGNGDYQNGQRSLDRREYEEAVKRFDRVIAAKGTRTDGAMFWKAYALHKLGRRDPALATLGDLEKQFPQSRWLNDSRALAAEVRSSTGTVSPDAAADEDLKLLALNSLINQEPDRAVPLLEKILGDTKSNPALKRQALFVLARSRTPRSREILTQYAKGGSNPDLQAKAIEFLGSFRSDENARTLLEVYSASNDGTLKREVIRALQRQNAAQQLVDLARKETDAVLKREIVRELSQMRSKESLDYLMELLNK